MRNSPKAKKLATRITAMGLTLVMGISLVGTLSFEASAVASLKGIEEIKNNGSLSILEIVPEANSGSIGYYVGGQEPTNNWYAQVAGKVGMDARATYANELFSKLVTQGLMNPATVAPASFPLANQGVYHEDKPWEAPSSEDRVLVKLLQPESQTVTGEIKACAPGQSGDYKIVYTYTLDNPDNNTDPKYIPKYIENAHFYEYKETSIVPAYYYHVDFESIRFTDISDPNDPRYNEDDVLYDTYLRAHPVVPLYIKKNSEGLPYYVYAGTLKASVDEDNILQLEGDFRLDISTNDAYGYYIAKPDYTSISTSRELLIPITVPTVVDPTLMGRTIYMADTAVEGGYRAIEVDATFVPDANKQYYDTAQGTNLITVTVVHPMLVGQTIYVADTPDANAGDCTPIKVESTYSPDSSKFYFAQDIMLPVTVPTEADGSVNSAYVGKTIYVADTTVEGGYRAVEVNATFKPYPYADSALNPQYYTSIKTHSYLANPYESPFREADTAAGEVPFFERTEAYSYVGDGSGTHNFVYDKDGQKTQTIEYDAIYVSGGYTNNEWFKHYVLDYALEENSNALNTRPVTIKVKSVTPATMNTVTISDYDLVVVSAGFDLTKNGSTVLYGSDLTAAQVAEIKQIPRVVDTAILNNTSRTNLLTLADGKTTPFVTGENNNVYYFAETTVDVDKLAGVKDTVNRLATNRFHTPINGVNEQNNPYMAVADEIRYENMIRGESDALPTDISMATCFRYVLNTRRIINKKTSLNVLDLRPAPIYDEITRAKDGTGNVGPLTVEDVLDWLPVSMQDQLAKKDGNGNVLYHNITITHMSTAALVGKIEDITEQYDLIYIGTTTKADWDKARPSDVNSTTWTNEWTAWQDQLNDKDNNNQYINNYQYVNIGAKQKTSRLVRGLLATETFVSSDTATTRYSGNDLTPTKKEELVQFAKARLPIVISEDLVTGDGSVVTTDYDMTVDLVLSDGKIKPVLHFDPVLKAKDYKIISYEWKAKKADGTDAELSNNKAAEIADPIYGYSYSCKVTVGPASGLGGESGEAYSGYYTYTEASNADARIDSNGGWGKAEVYYGRDYWGSFTGQQDESKSAATSTSANVTIYAVAEGYVRLPNKSDITYRWYDANNNEVATGERFIFPAANTPYSCQITIRYNRTNYTVTGPKYTWVLPQDTLTPSGTDSATGGTISIARTRDLNTDKIDINSLMYKALAEVWNNPDVNILVDSDLAPEDRTEDNEQKLVNALNLSRPSINFPKDSNGDPMPGTVPKSYSMDILNLDGEIPDGYRGDLKFEFKIANDTDPDPANTRYRVELYIDQNGDGRHTADEIVPGITIQSTIEGIKKRVTNGTLQADDSITYTVSRNLNDGQADQFSGIVAWKLQIVKVTDENVHASEKGYAYVHPTKRTELRILQVKSSAHNYNTSMVDLGTPNVTVIDESTGKPKAWETLIREYNNNGTIIRYCDANGDGQFDRGEDTNLNKKIDTRNGNEDTNRDNILDIGERLSQFQELFLQLYDAEMYHVTVDTKTVKNLNDTTASTIDGVTYTAQQNIFKTLNDYNMVILGFEDTYGELNDNSANAVVDYINTGKSLLFTHDTTSYWNNQNYTGAGDNGNGRKGWGYWFNQVIRDRVGLDRYGSTHPTYGKRQANASTAATFGLVASGVDGQINEESTVTINQLQQAGYTVAFVPGDVRNNVGYSALETQGYANSTIEINTFSNTGGNKDTTEVSQVNRGQITEYPYRLDKEMTVQSTHNQYYQLNMNSDDVVVWYNLGGSKYADEKNDVTNGYYIYNRGNITYSGAGHTPDLEMTPAEANLFVNTMIAAYRAGNGPAGVSFRTVVDDPASALLFPVQYSDEDEAVSLGVDQTTYFKIQDRNLTSGNTLSVNLYYKVDVDSDAKAEEIGADKATSVGITTGNATIDDKLYVMEVTPGAIYRMDNGDSAELDELKSEVLYKMVVPSAVFDEVAKMQGDGTLYLVVTTVIHSDAGDVIYKSFDDLMLQKLGLLRLE